MIALDIQSVAATKITVTSAATAMFTLMDTAGSLSVGDSRQYYTSRYADAVMITPEDGDIRYLVRGTPTATAGQLLKEGVTYYLPGLELPEMKLIRTGGSDVAVTVIPYRNEQGDGPMAVRYGSSAALDVTTDDVLIYGNTAKDGSGTDYVPLLDSDGHVQVDVLTGASGGTQYTEADTDATITGTAIMWEDAADTLRAVSAAKPLPISDAGGTLTVDGTVTANAGTNLNTSALALETGGNLATIAGDTTSIDGKITACNTGAVVVSSGAITETNSGTIASDTTSIDGKITACNTGAVTISAALPAGTNAIGKLAANTGVDIGDVDVTSIANGSINGPGAPTIDSYTHYAFNLTTGADQVIASSAANKQIWVYGFGITCGDADGQTVSFQDEDDTAITGVMEFKQYGGMAVSPSGNFAMPIWKLGTDKDLEVDITGGDVDGWLVYAVVSV